MSDELPGIDPTEPRWTHAAFGAHVQELIDAMTPEGYGRFTVDGWLLIAETESPDHTRQIMTLPFDRFQVPRLVGMLRIADQIMCAPGATGWKAEGLDNG